MSEKRNFNSKKWHFDQFLLIFYVIFALILRNWWYTAEMVAYWTGTTESGLFRAFWQIASTKILNNQMAFHKRPYIRNMVFDIMRCCSGSIIFPLIAGGLDAFDQNRLNQIFTRISGVTILSLLATRFVQPNWKTRSPVLWAIVKIE